MGQQCEQAGQNLQVFAIGRGLRDKGVELGQLLRRRVAVFEPGSTLELADEWEQRTVGMVRRAEIAQRDVWFSLELLVKRPRNVRLADTRLSQKHHYSAFLLFGVSPPAEQQIYLFFTPEQRRQLGVVHCLETAFHAAYPHYLPDCHRLRPAFRRERADIAIIEVAPGEPARVRTN